MTIRNQSGPRGYPLDPGAPGSALLYGVLREWEKDAERAGRYRNALRRIRETGTEVAKIAQDALAREGEL